MFSDRMTDGFYSLLDLHVWRHKPTHLELDGWKTYSGRKGPAPLRIKVMATRETSAQLQNATLKKYGHDVRVDSRSHQAHSMEREPERHLDQARIKKMPPEEQALFNAMRPGVPCASL